MDKFEAIKDDRLHQSLSSGWASFLAAQQCSHEVSALRQAFNEEIHRLDRMYSSLQRDSVRQHDLIAAAVTESKSLIEQHASELKEIITIQNSLLTLKQEASQDKEYMLTKINELSEKAVTQQESLEGIRSTTAQDISNAEGQYRSALEKLEFLQGELKELRAEKIASEQRLAALEHQIAAMAQAHRESPSETASLHDETLPLQDELMKFPDKVDCHVSSQASTQSSKCPYHSKKII
jgi:chromosome segregation ATPase